MSKLGLKSESGAVLIVVLGILALLTVMAVSFVYSTRQAMRASEAFMNTVTATDVAEVAISRAIATLEADKIKRMGDPLDPDAPITETHDSLRDSWRSEFSAPVIIQYSPIDETGLAVGDEVVNTANGARAKVLAYDRGLNRLYLNSISTALWDDADGDSTPDTLQRYPASTFEVTVSSIYKPDEVDLDGDAEWYTSNSLDDDSDGQTDEADEANLGNDAVWHNYYDESGKLVGRYAVLIQDELGKINVNAAGNLAGIENASLVYSVSSSNYFHVSNEGASPFEISLVDGLEATEDNARQIVFYRHGLPGSALTWNISTDWTSPAGNREDINRVIVAGQGDVEMPPLDASSDGIDNDGDSLTDEYGEWSDVVEDDDDNANRFLFRYDGVDNDGDGTIDEWDEGINEPQEFRVLRPVRLRPEAEGANPLEYDGIDNDGDSLDDETNEGDDQPILTLGQLASPQGVDLGNNFLYGVVTTSFDGVTDTPRERRHFMSTLSWDRNLDAYGELRANLNVMNLEETTAAINKTAYREMPAHDPFTRASFRNTQKALNIYDYRDRDIVPSTWHDDAGDVFAGVESIRINEVLVRAATNMYEAELFADNNPYWVRASDIPLGLLAIQLEGAGSPRGNENFLRNEGFTGNAASEGSLDHPDGNCFADYPPGCDGVGNPEFGLILPDPPFSSTGGPDSDGIYPFKLRMRVRSGGNVTNSTDRGFEVHINGVQVSGLRSIDPYEATARSISRWANLYTQADNWYIEEAFVLLEAADNLLVLDSSSEGANSIEFVKPGVSGGSDLQDTVDIDWLYFTQEPDCEWIELVNIGDTMVELNDWHLVSEYWKDVDHTFDSEYEFVEHQITLSGIEVPPVNSTLSPVYVVVALDRDIDDSGDSPATADNVADKEISFASTWDYIVENQLLQYVYQVSLYYEIYSPDMDFFGNEPMDIPGGVNVDVRGTGDPSDYVDPTLEVGRISLYDADGNLIDRVTYDAGNVAESFASLQRDHPANPGERMDSSNNFKTRSFRYDGHDPSIDDFNVAADGAYDDWKFWRFWENPLGDIWLTSSPIKSPPPGFVGYSPNSEGNSGWMTPCENNNFNWDVYGVRIQAPESRVKNHPFANVGEMGRVPFHNEFLAVIGYDEDGGTGDIDIPFRPGDTVISYRDDEDYDDSRPEQSGIIVSIHPTEDPYDALTGVGNPDAPSGWMIVRGDPNNPVNTWQPGEMLKDESGLFSASITSAKPLDAIEVDGLQFYAWIYYPSNAADVDLSSGDTITNTTTTQSGTAIYVDTDENYFIVEGDVLNPVFSWSPNDSIQNAETFGTTIVSVQWFAREPNVAMLADYFTTEMIDLAASTGFSPLVEVMYEAAADASLAVGSTITNTSFTPNQIGEVVKLDTTNDWLQLKPIGTTRDLYSWVQDNTIDDGAGFNSTILATSADNWPTQKSPKVYRFLTNDQRIRFEWGEDEGVQSGTYDLYVRAESTTKLEITPYDGDGNTLGDTWGDDPGETPSPDPEPHDLDPNSTTDPTYDIGTIYYGPITIKDGGGDREVKLILDLNNIIAALDQYQYRPFRFARAILAPPRETFGRINVNTASERVLRGLPGFSRIFAVYYNDTSDEEYLALKPRQRIVSGGESATLLAFNTEEDPDGGTDTEGGWLALELDESTSFSAWQPGASIANTDSSFSSTITKLVTLPEAVINARNAQAIYTVGGVYLAGEFSPAFSPDVLGDISNLITTRSDIYKIIVRAQAAIDSNENGIIEDDEVTSEKRMEMIYQR